MLEKSVGFPKRIPIKVIVRNPNTFLTSYNFFFMYLNYQYETAISFSENVRNPNTFLTSYKIAVKVRYFAQNSLKLAN